MSTIRVIATWIQPIMQNSTTEQLFLSKITPLTISLIGTNTWLSLHRHRHQHIHCHDHHQVAYCVPAYLLAGLHYPDIGDLTSFYLYIGIQWWMQLAAKHIMALTLKMMTEKLRTAGYMLLYLACLRALTICLATVSSSRLIKGAPVIKDQHSTLIFKINHF